LTFFSLFLEASPAAPDQQPGFKTYQPGETIIVEGDNSDLGMALMRGRAEVFVQGVKVGEVGPEEIFGATGAVTGAPRSATVVATKPSSVMFFSREDFTTVLRTHPDVISKLVEAISRALRDTNARVVEMSRFSAP
jgi:CRP-like cAMP-binding protein